MQIEMETVANHLITGASFHMLFGPVAALAAVVLSIAIPKLSGSEEKPPLPMNGQTASELVAPWRSYALPLFSAQLALGAFLKYKRSLVNQVAISWIRQGFKSFAELFRRCVRVAVVAPIVEEFVFRGFLQDRICELQKLAFGAKAAMSKVHTFFRIALQATLFGLAHYHPIQGSFNLFIVSSTAIGGFFLGWKKENTQSITQSISSHSLINTSVVTRIVLFGT